VELSNQWSVFLLGFAGGCISEFLHWWSLRTEPEFPNYARRMRYWIITAGMASGRVIPMQPRTYVRNIQKGKRERKAWYRTFLLEWFGRAGPHAEGRD
jgi:hypothetical protein